MHDCDKTVGKKRVHVNKNNKNTMILREAGHKPTWI